MSPHPSPTATRATYLVVAYNHAAFIEQCLDSIRGQTEAAELIVIDDASTDNTRDVLRDYASRTGHEFRAIIHDTNVGLGPSLVEGLALVETEFFGYIAGDDWMEPERTQVQVSAMHDAGPTCALSYSDVYRADDQGVRIEPTLSVGMGAEWQPESTEPYPLLLRANWIPAPSIMIRTQPLRDVGGYDPDIFYEDHDVVLRLTRDYEAACIDTPLATHRELTTSLGHRMFFYEETRSAWLRARVLIMRKHLPGRTENTHHFVATQVRDMLVALYMRGESPDWLRGHLTELSPHLPGDVLIRRHLRLIRWRVPGRVTAKTLGARARAGALLRPNRPAEIDT